MKALSIRQPWVEIILSGDKNVENRVWETKYRGAVLLHASKTVDREDFDYYQKEYGLDYKTMPVGAILGIADIVDCTLDVRSKWHVEGQYGWYLENVRRFSRPLPYKGALRLFDVDDELVRDAIASSVIVR